MASLTMNDMTHLNMQQSIVSTLFTKYKSDDAMYNIFIMILITSMFKYFMDSLANIFVLSNFRHYMMTSYYVIKDLLKRKKVVKKQVNIAKTTDQKEINTLYDACDWYISTQQCLDTKKETYYNVSCKDDFARISDSSTIKLNKRTDFDTYKEFKFQDHTINYIVSKSLMTTYGDQERKKENYSITFKAYIKDDKDIDILDKLCVYIADEYVKFKNPKLWKQEIFVNDREGKWKGSPSDNERKLSTISLKGNLCEDITEDLEQFMTSKQWYNNNGIPYMRGYLLYGPPGTGKSSIIKAVSNYTKRHIHYVMFSNITSDSQLMDLLNAIDFNKTILVMEDIDATIEVIKKRKPEVENIGKKEIQDTIREEMTKYSRDRDNERGPKKSNNAELTLAGILNALDGIFSMSGRILIMTSNRPEELDNALTRAGRVDRKIKLDYCDKTQVKKLYKKMFESDIDDDILADFVDDKYPPALIVQIFMRYVRGVNKLTRDVFNSALRDDSIY